MKISVVLLEHNDLSDQETLEKSLITHNHHDLLMRIKSHVSVNFGTPHNEFLSLLSEFYKSSRYSRFSISSVYSSKREVENICNFIGKHLGINIETESTLFGIKNDDQYRKFIRKVILKISSAIYGVITESARSLNIYTYELRHGSKAETVFLGKVDISDEDLLWKELLIFFMNTPQPSGYLDFLRQISPLDFDPALVNEYLDCFQSDNAKANVMGELEHHYNELDDKNERLEQMRIIGASNVFFDDHKDEF